MVVNHNGQLQKDVNQDFYRNRGLLYGDAVFETVRAVHQKLFFWEDHYLRLMASMRIMRMDIPMEFTMEFLQSEVEKTLTANSLETSAARVKILVYRNPGGFYTPTQRSVGYFVDVAPIDEPFYLLKDETCEVDLYKDHYVSPSLLSTIKTNNKAIHILGGIYAQENGLNDCLLLNTDKMVVEGLSGNLFMVKGTTIKTPPLSDGPLRGVLRKQLIQIIEKWEGYELEEATISPFELQKADELFITNVIKGIRPITKYRKKVYTSEVSKQLIGKLNAMARLA